MEDRKKIEAVLFAVGDKIEEEEISRLTRLPIETVKTELHQLREDYSQAKSTFIVLNEGGKWKLTVREDYMPIVQKIVPKTELSRPVLETLAVIAWKSPVLQSNIISIRSTKAYDHISELEQVGFITKQRYGRSFMLKLSQQFFEYFDIQGKEQIKDVFKGIKGTDDTDMPQEQGGQQEMQDKEKGKSDPDKDTIEMLPAEAADNLPSVSQDKEAGLPMAEPKSMIPAPGSIPLPKKDKKEPAKRGLS